MARIAFLVPGFPRLSETFVSAEVHRLQQLGEQVSVFSFKRPSPGDAGKLDAPVRALMAETNYIGPGEAVLGALSAPARVIGGAGENRRITEAATLKSSPALRLLRAAALAGELRRRHIRHVHAHWPYAAQVACLASHISGCTFSLSVHAHEVAHDNGHFPVVLPQASFATFCNRGAMQYLLQRLPPNTSRKAHLVYHGVDLQRFRPLELPVGGPLRILSAGRLTPTKGFDRLIRSCAAAVTAGVDLRLTLLGQGVIADELARLADQLGFGARLSMPGWVPHDSVQRYIEDAHVFALLADGSFHDGLPNVVLEAMACGRPAILAPLPAAAEAVASGVEGFILRHADDTAGFVAAATELAANPGRIAAMGRAARSRVERDHDADFHIRRLRELLEVVAKP